MKRTPLKRTGISPVSKRRRKRDASYNDARDYVHARGEGICEASTYGIACGQSMSDVHHIAGRGGPDPHNLANLIGLCWWHHRKVHAEPEWARETGLMATRHGGAS